MVNRSDVAIEALVVELPSSRVVFGPVAPGEERTILHSTRQADGVYRYAIRFPSAARRVGQCGYVTSSEFGKRLALIVRSPTVVDCKEGRGLF